MDKQMITIVNIVHLNFWKEYYCTISSLLCQ